MANHHKKIKDRVEILEDARAQISKGYLELERERAHLRSAIENLQIAFIMLDDYKKIIFKNIAVDEILGPIDSGGWTIEKLEKLLTGKYDIKKDIEACFQERIRFGPKDISISGKTLRFFISPIIIFKKSLTVPSIVIIIEDITT